MNQKIALVCGATQGIGLSFTQLLLESNSYSKIYATYRKSSSLTELNKLMAKHNKLTLVLLDVEDESSYADLATTLSKESNQLDLCINFIGTLNDKNTSSERSLRDASIESSLWSFKINTLPTLMLAKHLKSMIHKSDNSVFAAVSAKVGITSENYLGGWYSYRSSKAALNMTVKNISIEFKRDLPKCSVLAIHPGTTATELSKQFLDSARKKYTIHMPIESAQNILKIVQSAKPETHNGVFFNWDKTELPW